MVHEKNFGYLGCSTSYETDNDINIKPNILKHFCGPIKCTL
jgi:hypothetical protein